MEHINLLKSVILPYANFAIFLVAAIYFFKNPAIQAARKAREAFQKSAAEAEASRAAAEARVQGLRQRLGQLDQEIRNIREISRSTAENEAKNIIIEAEKLAKHIGEEAERVSHAEIEKARNALRQEIVQTVKEVVVSRIKAEINSEGHHVLVKKQIRDLEAFRN